MKLVVLDLQRFFEGLCYKCFPLNLPEYFITAIMWSTPDKTGFLRAEIVMFTVMKARHDYVFQPEF